MRLGILLSGRGSNFLAIAGSERAGRLKGVEHFRSGFKRLPDARSGLKAARNWDCRMRFRFQKGRKRAEQTPVIACLKAHTVDWFAWQGICGCYRRSLWRRFRIEF